MHAMHVLKDLALPVLALYMIVLANFLPELIGCRLQHTLKTSMPAKHALGLVLLYCLVVLTSPAGATAPGLAKQLGWAALVYCAFLVTTRAPFSVMLTVILLLLLTHVCHVRAQAMPADAPDAARRKAALHLAGGWAAVAAAVASLFGMALYLHEKRLEYGHEFSLVRFFTGTTSCRNYTPLGARLL